MTDFSIDFKDSELEDLRSRIDNGLFPAFTCDADWELGTHVNSLRDILEQWKVYDWKSQQDYLNSYPQYGAGLRM